jgi:hypothetical protein
VVITYNGSALGTIGNWKCYIDGNSKTIGTGGGWFNSGTPINTIGNYRNYHYDGKIDELAVFSSLLSASAVTSIYNSGTPTDLTSLSPAGWWRMGDDATWDGTDWTIPDASANSNAGTTVNMAEGSRVTAVPPKLSTLSGSFDGTNDYVSIDDATGLTINGDVTISLWFRSASLPGSAAFDYMFSLSDGQSLNGQDRAIGIRGTGSDAQIVGNTYGSGWNTPFTNTSVAVDTWCHVAAIFTSGSVQIYFNGVDKGSKSVTTIDLEYNETVIGGMKYSGANYFNGFIDEVSVFNSALSASNVTAIYNSGQPADLTSLSPVGWWRLGDGTGDTDSGGGAPANTDTIGTVANQGSLGSSANGTGTNGALYSSTVP